MLLSHSHHGFQRIMFSRTVRTRDWKARARQCKLHTRTSTLSGGQSRTNYVSPTAGCLEFYKVRGSIKTFRVGLDSVPLKAFLIQISRSLLCLSLLLFPMQIMIFWPGWNILCIYFKSQGKANAQISNGCVF